MLCVWLLSLSCLLQLPPSLAESDLRNPLSVALGFTSSSHVTPQTELKVIGAGFPRTGTTSSKVSLEMLGFKVFSWEDMVNLGLQTDLLLAMNSDFFLEQFTQKILNLGYNATLDSPSQVLALRWASRFPNSKLLLTVRDSPQQWASSFRTLLRSSRFWNARPFTWYRPHLLLWFELAMMEMWKLRVENIRCDTVFFWYDCFEDVRVVPEGEGVLEDAYEKWNARVTHLIPSHRLLVFNSAQGWGSLLEFLSVSTSPEGPFPRINESSFLAKIENTMFYVALGWPFGLVFGVVVSAWVARLLIRTVLSFLY